MQWVGKQWLRICALVALGSGVIACGDDDDPGSTDGGTGGTATGGTSGSGGKSPGGAGGASGGAGGASGGAGGASGGAGGAGGGVTGGNGGATGGVGSGTGGATCGTDGGSDGAADPDGGIDGSVDGSVDGSPEGGTDGSSGGAPLCPISSTWPIGTYALNAHVAEYRSGVNTLPPPFNEERCSLEAQPHTLSITAPVIPSDCLIVAMDLADRDGPITFCGWLEDRGPVLRLIDTLCVGTPSPFPPCVYVDLDRATGAIVALKYYKLHTAPFGDQEDMGVTGTGYPRCSATQATPPALPPPARPAYGSCTNTPTAPLGCEYTYTTQYESFPVPTCPASSGACTCEPYFDIGTLTKCCPPS